MNGSPPARRRPRPRGLTRCQLSSRSCTILRVYIYACVCLCVCLLHVPCAACMCARPLVHVRADARRRGHSTPFSGGIATTSRFEVRQIYAGLLNAREAPTPVCGFRGGHGASVDFSTWTRYTPNYTPSSSDTTIIIPCNQRTRISLGTGAKVPHRPLNLVLVFCVNCRRVSKSPCSFMFITSCK